MFGRRDMWYEFLDGEVDPSVDGWGGDQGRDVVHVTKEEDEQGERGGVGVGASK